MRAILLALAVSAVGAGPGRAAQPDAASCANDARYAPKGLDAWKGGTPGKVEASTGCPSTEPPGHNAEGNQANRTGNSQ